MSKSTVPVVISAARTRTASVRSKTSTDIGLSSVLLYKFEPNAFNGFSLLNSRHGRLTYKLWSVNCCSKLDTEVNYDYRHELSTCRNKCQRSKLL